MDVAGVWRMDALAFLLRALSTSKNVEHHTASQLHPTYPSARRSPLLIAVASTLCHLLIVSAPPVDVQTAATMDYDAEGGAINVRFLQVHRPLC